MSLIQREMLSKKSSHWETVEENHRVSPVNGTARFLQEELGGQEGHMGTVAHWDTKATQSFEGKKLDFKRGYRIQLVANVAEKKMGVIVSWANLWSHDEQISDQMCFYGQLTNCT